MACLPLGCEGASITPCEFHYGRPHPSLFTKNDIDEIAVPVKILAPEIDLVYTAELKMYSFETIRKLSVPFDYSAFSCS